MSVRLAVRVTPNARADELLGFSEDGTLRVKLAAPPVDGRANEALVAFLATLLRVPKSSVAIKTGAGARTKVLVVTGLDATALRERLRTTLL